MQTLYIVDAQRAATMWADIFLLLLSNEIAHQLITHFGQPKPAKVWLTKMNGAKDTGTLLNNPLRFHYGERCSYKYRCTVRALLCAICIRTTSLIFTLLLIVNRVSELHPE